MKKAARFLSNLMFILRPAFRYGKAYLVISILSSVVSTYLSTYAAIRLPSVVINSIMSVSAGAASYGELLRSVAGLSLLALLAHLIYLLGNYFSSILQINMLYSIDIDIAEQGSVSDLQNLDNPEFFDAYSIVKQSFMSSVLSLFSSVTSLFIAVSTLSAALAAITQVSPVILAVIAAGVVATFLTDAAVSKKNIELNAQIALHRRYPGYLSRALFDKTSAMDIRVGNVKKILFARARAEVDTLNKKYARGDAKVRCRNALNMLISQGVNFTMIALIARDVIKDSRLLAGDYASLLAASQALSDAIRTFTLLFSSLVRESQQAEQYRLFFEAENKIDGGRGGAEPPDGRLEVQLRNMSFRYPNADFCVKGVDINIAAGEKIAIVGENGAGKSTLAKLLLRLYDIDGGDILYNGKSARDYDLRKMRNRIGVAFQTPNVFALTMRENISTYHAASDEKLAEILRELDLDRVLEKNSATLDSEVTREFDPKGIILSGGEAQKLAVARILTGDFGLLVLDEPSSALDPLAEYKLMKTILGKANTTTTIIVAHRLSTIRNADRIYVISNGEVAEAGTHDELMALGGKYAEMFSLQAENYVAE
ncbi:MAG: ABC transporter ATP-binding protein/permease [Oscillospiraceae bacterium]|nr:ABC transporter ATP-binding protein/permease [Oscillospiraceae bacterium]